MPPATFVDRAVVGIDAASDAVFVTWRSVVAPMGWSVRTPLGKT